MTTGSSTDTVPTSSTATTMPAAYGQRQLWLHNQLHGSDGTYNIPLNLRVAGPVDADLVARSVNEIVRRHEALRTTFRADGGDLVQVIAGELTVPVALVEAPTSSDPERLGWVRARIAADGATAFDLVAGPLLRVTVYRLRPDDHVLSVVVHHTVFDGWSVGVFVTELATLYGAFVAGSPVPLPDLELQFADFATWQRDQLEAGALAESLEFWRERLMDAPTWVSIPTDHPRGRLGRRPGRMLVRQTSPAARAALAEMARREGVTQFMVFAAALAAFLHRQTRETDFVIGTPFSGRDREELEPLIGYFINTVLLRCRLDADMPFRAWLADVRQIVLDAHRHQDAPLDAVQSVVRAARDGADPPQLQVMLALQNATPDPPLFGGHPTSLLWVHNDTAKFDWFLNVTDDREGLRYELEYDTSLFDEATAVGALDQFGVLLEAAVAEPATTIGALPLIDTAEAERIVAALNDPERYARTRPDPFDAGETLASVFERAAARTPDAVALTGDGAPSLTYGQLNAQANRLARYLRSAGVGPNVLVGICFERTPRVVVAMLAVVKAGGAYLPIDLAYPPERLAFMLEDAGARLLLTERAVEARLPSNAGLVCWVDDVLAGPAAADALANLALVAGPDDLAYVIYTSGTTGRPKGSQISHRNVLSLFVGTDRLFEFGEHDVWTLFHSYAFDFSVWEVWGALLFGGRLVVVPYLVSREPERFVDLVARERVTVLNQTPSAFRQFVHAEGLRPAAPLGLRYVILGGEALDMRSLQPWYDRHGDTQPAVINMYGITETTVFVTYRPLSRRDLTGPSEIGHPIPLWEMYVLDAHLRPTPVGVPGEIYVGGAGVSRGYLKRDALTREKFVANPFSGRSAMLYRSGDLARARPNGDVEYLGRIDQQVKIRGFRIETAEIENVATETDAIAQCAVIARQDAAGSTQLVAYLVPAGADDLDLDALRAHLRRRLPDYMVPTSFVSVPVMPLTNNGKLDVARLPPPSAQPRRVRDGDAAATPTETALAAIWRELLPGAEVARTDSFFDIGGHSLLAMRLAHRVHDVFGVPLPLGTLFDAPVLADLATRIDQLKGIAPAAAEAAPPILVPLAPGGGGAPFFWVHGVGGEIYQYMVVSKHLARTRAVLGFSADWTTMPEEETTSLATIATRYIRELKAVRASGPYHFGGFCSASPLMVEMVRQLEEAGDRVGVCAAIGYDLRPLSTSPRGLRAVWRFARELPRWIREDALPSGPGELLGRVMSRFRHWAMALGLVGKTSAVAPDIRDKLGMWRFPEYAVPMLEFHQARITAFTPRPVRSRVLLCLPSGHPLFGPWLTGPHADWARIARGGITERHIAASHFGILQDPYAAELARVLEEAIAEAERLPGSAALLGPHS